MRPPVLFPGLQKQLGPETWLISQDRDAWCPQPSLQPSSMASLYKPPTRVPARCVPCAPNNGLPLAGAVVMRDLQAEGVEAPALEEKLSLPWQPAGRTGRSVCQHH